MGLASGTWGALHSIVASQTNLQQTNGVVWVMLGISVGGAIVTFAFLVYSVWKWRDRQADRRRYG